jgi:hypothetical protein
MAGGKAAMLAFLPRFFYRAYCGYTSTIFMKTRIRSAVGIALLCACILPAGAAAPTSSPAQAAAMEYAPIKQMLCTDCGPQSIPAIIRPPRRGFVLSRGSFLGTAGSWAVFDVDARTLSSVGTVYDQADPKRELKLDSRVSWTLPEAEFAELVRLANAAWASPQSLPSDMATDVAWGLYLVDGTSMRHEWGPGLPAGLAGELARSVASITERHVQASVPERQ